MSQIKVENVEKNFDYILEKVGNETFVDWEKFSRSSAEIINAIDELNKKMSHYREYQHRNFIQTMKKLKGLDLPDLITSVRNKKLPKQALRGVLGRFKAGEGEKIELVDSVDTLKQNAQKDFEEYVNRNTSFLEELKKYEAYIEQKIKDFGFAPEEAVEPLIKATVKFNLSEELATKLASDIKIEYVPGTSYINLKTYTNIVTSSYDLIKEQNIRLTVEARIKQRESIKDDVKYLAVMNEFLLNGEALIIEGQKLISKKLGLSENKLEESEIFLMERGLGQHMLMIQSQLRAKVKECLPAKQDVPFDAAKEIIVYQTNMITQQQDRIKKILDGLEKTQDSVQSIPMLLALILNDMVFNKYGFEEEDFMKNVSEEVIATNPELGKIFKDMELSIIKLMQHIGVIQQDLGKIMEQNAMQQGQQPQGQMPGLMPGMMAGSNPMEMLQMQQMQQMQQMMAKNGNH